LIDLSIGKFEVNYHANKCNLEVVHALIYLDLITRICRELNLIVTFADHNLTTFAIRNWHTSRCIKVHHLQYSLTPFALEDKSLFAVSTLHTSHRHIWRAALLSEGPRQITVISLRNLIIMK